MATAAPPRETVPTALPERPDLTPLQKETILAATGELIRATIEARAAHFADPSLGGTTSKAVAGAFVSLKRGKHLRACCGGLQQQPLTLGRAVYEAALRTALEDGRFPPLSPTELAHLDIEVWLLFNPEPVTARGEERVGAVQTGGKHGLVIERGPNRGLLLPGVAVEHNWDARRFLEHTCLKAGLHSSLWKDDETTVLTFEGDAIRGRLGRSSGAAAHRPAALLRPEQLPAYVDFCRSNIAALLVGATPTFYAAGVPDGTFNAVALSLRRPGDSQPLHLNQYALRPGIPLQATLFSFAQLAAQALTRDGITADELGSIEMSLTILYDPAMHGTVADPHLDGLEPKHRAVMVVERAKYGIAYDPKSTAANLLAEGARQAEIISPSSAAVFSLEAISNVSSVAVANVPRPEAGPAVRPAAVAGKFYPEEEGELSKIVDDLLPIRKGGGNPKSKTPAAFSDRKIKPWPAALVPHAGLRFSGRIAAAVFRRLALAPTIIVLGPKHTPFGMDWAVAPHETWSLPGCNIRSDPVLARQLVDAIPGLALDSVAHQQEHAIEVELPFIARLAPQAKVVGIAIGHGDLPSCHRFAEGLATVLRECKTMPLLLISSDMNHFATDDENRRLDAIALAALEELDADKLYETVTENQISMCGLLPAVIVLKTLQRLQKLSKAERVGYATSADVTGDKSRVVGYAGMLFG